MPRHGDSLHEHSRATIEQRRTFCSVFSGVYFSDLSQLLQLRRRACGAILPDSQRISRRKYGRRTCRTHLPSLFKSFQLGYCTQFLVCWVDSVPIRIPWFRWSEFFGKCRTEAPGSSRQRRIGIFASTFWAWAKLLLPRVMKLP